MKNDSQLSQFSTIEISKKYTKGECPSFINTYDLTKGWSYLLAKNIHRFFYKNYNFYKVLGQLDQKQKIIISG